MTSTLWCTLKIYEQLGCRPFKGDCIFGFRKEGPAWQKHQLCLNEGTKRKENLLKLLQCHGSSLFSVILFNPVCTFMFINYTIYINIVLLRCVKNVQRLSFSSVLLCSDVFNIPRPRIERSMFQSLSIISSVHSVIQIILEFRHVSHSTFSGSLFF